MIDTKFTKQRFKDHFYYSKWMYVAFIAAGILVFSLVYSVTAPTIPNEYKVDICVLVSSLDDTEAAVWEEDILSLLTADQLEVNIYSLGMSGSSDETLGGYSVYEILAARMAAQEGDIYITSKEVYDSLAAQGAFMSLDDLVANYEYPEEIDLDEYLVNISADDGGDGEDHMYGLPLDEVYGLVDMSIDPTDMVISVMVYTENYDNAITALDYVMNKTESEVLNSVLTTEEE